MKSILFFLPLEKITPKAGGSLVTTKRLWWEFDFQSAVTECQFTPGIKVLFCVENSNQDFCTEKLAIFFLFSVKSKNRSWIPRTHILGPSWTALYIGARFIEIQIRIFEISRPKRFIGKRFDESFLVQEWYATATFLKHSITRNKIASSIFRRKNDLYSSLSSKNCSTSWPQFFSNHWLCETLKFAIKEVDKGKVSTVKR